METKTNELAKDFATQLMEKIIIEKLYTWKEETIPKNTEMVIEETCDFMMSLEKAIENNGLVNYYDEVFDLSLDLYGQTDTYGIYGLAESYACKIVNELQYCVYDSCYYSQMCKAVELFAEKAYQFIKSLSCRETI